MLHRSNGLTETQSASIDATLASLFGTPDNPAQPADLTELAALFDEDRLQQAAGPVISHEPGVTQGLYRRHCARCHGVTGDGRGPVARHLAPLPRDFRRGLFKWKSTYAAVPPTDADLHAVLQRGVPGSSMPSFALLSEEERATLVEYVKYLALRGQTERALVAFVAEELAIGASMDDRETLREEFVADWLRPALDAWQGAEDQVVRIAGPPPGADPIVAGEKLYHSERAGCVKCHGTAGQGGAVAGVDYPIDYDRWTRDLVEVRDSRGRQIDETLASRLRSELPIRPSIPRRIAGATPHGGDSFATLYRSIHQGIAGTTMPAVGEGSPGIAGSLTDEEVAQLTAYVASLMRSTGNVTPSADRLEELAAR